MQNDTNNIKDDKMLVCSWSGKPAQIIWVRGRVQGSF